ncbi:putative annexin [Helianthus anomalus]
MIMLTKGFGSDDAAVIGILAHRDATQRAYIQQEYKTMYSEDILKRLFAKLSGKLETAVLLWRTGLAQRDAKLLIDALSPDCIDLEAVTEVRCSRTSLQQQTLKRLYHLTCGTYLEHDIELQDSGDHQKVIKKETSGLFEHTLLTILQCAENPAKYFAKVLYKSMQGLQTNDTTLIRVIVTRTEINMQYIKAEYHKKYNKNLNDAVYSETPGHYRTSLLSLLGPNH